MNHTIRYLGRLFALLILCTAGALLARAGLYYLGMPITFACGWFGCLSTVAFLARQAPASSAALAVFPQVSTSPTSGTFYPDEGLTVRADAAPSACAECLRQARDGAVYAWGEAVRERDAARRWSARWREAARRYRSERDDITTAGGICGLCYDVLEDSHDYNQAWVRRDTGCTCAPWAQEGDRCQRCREMEEER